jgi:hypothetical protein
MFQQRARLPSYIRSLDEGTHCPSDSDEAIRALLSLSTFRFQRVCELNGLQKHQSDLLNVITLSCLAYAFSKSRSSVKRATFFLRRLSSSYRCSSCRYHGRTCHDGISASKGSTMTVSPGSMPAQSASNTIKQLARLATLS